MWTHVLAINGLQLIVLMNTSLTVLRCINPRLNVAGVTIINSDLTHHAYVNFLFVWGWRPM